VGHHQQLRRPGLSGRRSRRGWRRDLLRPRSRGG
jgi:hypothetical protein